MEICCLEYSIRWSTLVTKYVFFEKDIHIVDKLPQDQATIPLDQQSSSSFTGEIGGNGSHEDKQDLAKTSTYDTSVQTSQNQPRQSD